MNNVGQDPEDRRHVLELQKEIWEKAVDTQMHFNEMCVKSRQLGLTFVVAALGLAVVLLGRNDGVLIKLPVPFTDHQLTLHAATLVVGIAAAGLYAVRRLDLGVYHQMLRGAVKFGEELEKGIIRPSLTLTPLGMTEFISLYSRNKDVKLNANGTYTGSSQRLAGDKIARFYLLTISTLLAIAALLFVLYFDWQPINQSSASTKPSLEAAKSIAPNAPSGTDKKEDASPATTKPDLDQAAKGKSRNPSQATDESSKAPQGQPTPPTSNQ